MNTAHDIHIVNHEQDLPPPGQDSQPNRSGKRRRKAAHASHFGCSDTSCEDIRVGDSKKYGRHLLDVHAEASSNERYGSSSVSTLLSGDLHILQFSAKFQVVKSMLANML